MLSEEQAIENLKKIREDTIKANECGLSNNDFKIIGRVIKAENKSAFK